MTSSQPINSNQDWTTITQLNESGLPEWAQFFVDLGRMAAQKSGGANKTWRLVTVPHRKMVAALFSLGFVEASQATVLQTIDAFNLSDLRPGDLITIAEPHGLSCASFRRIEPPDSKFPGKFSYVPVRRQKGELICYKNVSDARKVRLARYFGEPYTKFRDYRRDYFDRLNGKRSIELSCFSESVLCIAGRPSLREDLESEELRIDGRPAAIKDILRVRDFHQTDEANHFLTEYVSPDSADVQFKTTTCAVFDGFHAYPRLKSYIQATEHLIVLDRWDKGSVESLNFFDLERASHNQRRKYSPEGMDVPRGIEYVEWEEPNDQNR